LGLLRGVTYGGGAAITRGGAFVMLYHALDAERLVALSYGNQARLERAEKSLRDVLMENQAQGLIQFRGIVTADYYTYLSDPVPRIKRDEVEVGGRIFSKGGTDAGAYLGMEVDVYLAKVSEDSEIYMIKEIAPTVNNARIEVAFRDVGSMDKNEIRYYEDGAARAAAKSLASARYVYNGRLIDDASDLDVSAMRDGKITLLFHRDTDEVRFVFIEEYQSFIVDRTAARDEENVTVFFANNKMLAGSGKVALGEEHEVTYGIYDSDGAAISYEELRGGDLISVFLSADRALVKIIKSGGAAEGVITSANYGDGQIVLDDTPYTYEKGLDVAPFMGKDVRIRLNFEGKAAYITAAERDADFAGIVEIRAGKKLSSPYEILLVVPDLLTDEVEDTEADDSYDDNEIPAISGKNARTMVIAPAGSVLYNGDKRTAAEAVAAMQAQMDANNADFLAVRYGLDADGNLKRIDLPEVYKMGNERYYNAYEKTFSDGKFLPDAPNVFGGFGLSGDTLAICVPDNGDKGVVMEDYLAKAEMNNGQKYYVEAYAFNKETKCPDLILIHTPMAYRTSGAVDGKSKAALVGKVSNVLDESGAAAVKVQMVEQDGAREVFVSEDTTSGADFGGIRAGDLIRYSLDSRDRLDGFELLQRCDPVPDTVYSNGSADKVVFVGNITEVTYNEVSHGLNKWAHLVEIQDDDGNAVTYHIPRKSAPPIFVYDTRKRTAEAGSAEDLSRPCKRAVIYASGTTSGVGLSGSVTSVKAVVIIL
jgi:hypothetical protein